MHNNMKPSVIREAIPEAAAVGIRSIRFFVLAVIALSLGTLMSEAHAQESLALLKTYDLGESRYSEGLDFHDAFLWHTTSGNLYKLDPDSATDTDGDGDFDLTAEKTWNLTHHNYSESSVWFNGELYNFTYRDSTGSLSDDIYKLDLNDDETYQWQHAGDGQGVTNWGSCRDRSNPDESIIYTGHYDDLLMWYDPDTGNTTRTLEITGLDDIEDLGMDRYGTVWASSFNSSYPGLYRIDPDTGEIVGTFDGPDGLAIIDGLAIRSIEDHDVMYVTGKNTPYIWEYLVPEPGTTGLAGVAFVPETIVRVWPNPFNPQTTIEFALQEAGQVRLAIYDIGGRRVAQLVDGFQQAGPGTVTWDGRDRSGASVASGVYFARLQTAGGVHTQKLVLAR